MSFPYYRNRNPLHPLALRNFWIAPNGWFYVLIQKWFNFSELVKVPQNQPPQIYSNPPSSDEDFIPPDDIRKLNIQNEVKDEMDSNEIPKFYDDSGNAKQYKFFKINQRFPKYIH